MSLQFNREELERIAAARLALLEQERKNTEDERQEALQRSERCMAELERRCREEAGKFLKKQEPALKNVLIRRLEKTDEKVFLVYWPGLPYINAKVACELLVSKIKEAGFYIRLYWFEGMKSWSVVIFKDIAHENLHAAGYNISEDQLEIIRLRTGHSDFGCKDCAIR